MSNFSPRSGKANYIKPRGKSFYYRRAIPPEFRWMFGGKSEWNIKLEGPTDASRRAEAAALAHQHNKAMMYDVMEDVKVTDDDIAMRLDFTPMTTRPFKFRRDGQVVETFKIAISDDPDYLRQAERDGYFGMRQEEGLVQVGLAQINQAIPRSEGTELELNELKAANYTRQIDEMVPASGDTLRSILPKMHSQNNPRASTRASHLRAVEEFIALHGDLQLAAITKQHLNDYVEHLCGVRNKGKPLAPTTVQQRLEKMSAILEFATSVDAVEYNVAKAVKAPKDKRPIGDQTYKPFTKAEIRKLVEVATQIWTERKYQAHRTRMSRVTDSITALHMLIWTGARPEEICQLRLADVDLERRGIIITNESDDLGVRRRILKNEESVRGIPIHHRLLPSLEEHIEYIRSVSNSGLLFPSFVPGTEKGRYASPIGLDWSAHFRPHVSTDPQKVLYSLRHSWAGASKDVGMSETMRNAIMGHTSDSKSASAKRYTHHFDDLHNQLEWVDKMDCIGG
ncbi:tyrosine-type recombinase/integrase [Thalassobius sp. Cn5-15]|uniref:tyrosine-type recombinase/integrase n=1 Tax=Thalassobius sp. Cn5-15 TaxID=2917763 RepID=UPI001EF30B3D